MRFLPIKCFIPLYYNHQAATKSSNGSQKSFLLHSATILASVTQSTIYNSQYSFHALLSQETGKLLPTTHIWWALVTSNHMMKIYKRFFQHYSKIHLWRWVISFFPRASLYQKIKKASIGPYSCKGTPGYWKNGICYKKMIASTTSVL